MQNVEKIYIILLNYNGWKDTIECLESVLKNDYPNYQIIVVDNDSPNKSMDYIIDWTEGNQQVIYAEGSELEKLSQPFEDKPLNYIFYSEEDALKGGDKRKETQFNNPLIFIQSNDNGGFAAGNNIGIKYALEKADFEYIWLLNNDTVIEKNTLSSLAHYASKNDIGIAGSTLMYYGNPKEVQAYGGNIHRLFGIGHHIINLDDIKEKLDYIIGASFLIHKKVIDKIGLLPEEYFLYYEETDYCFHARNNGFKLGISLDSIVFHKEGGSTGIHIDPLEKSEFSDILMLKNRIKFHKKYLDNRFFLWLGMAITFFNRIRRGQASRIYKVFR